MNSSIDSELSLLLASRLLVEEVELVQSLAKRVNEDQEFKENLKQLIFKKGLSSEKEEECINTAANSITILVAANVSFSGQNLSGIIIRGANLADGCFNGCDFNDADLTGVNMENCQLDKTIFRNTNLSNITLGIHPEIKVAAKITSCCLSKDGQFILSGSDDCTVKLWERSTRNLLRTF